MRNGIYIRPAIVRLMALLLAAGTVRVIRHQIPVTRRYIKFETM